MKKKRLLLSLVCITVAVCCLSVTAFAAFTYYDTVFRGSAKLPQSYIDLLTGSYTMLLTEDEPTEDDETDDPVDDIQPITITVTGKQTDHDILLYQLTIIGSDTSIIDPVFVINEDSPLFKVEEIVYTAPVTADVYISLPENTEDIIKIVITALNLEEEYIFEDEFSTIVSDDDSTESTTGTEEPPETTEAPESSESSESTTEVPESSESSESTTSAPEEDDPTSSTSNTTAPPQDEQTDTTTTTVPPQDEQTDTTTTTVPPQDEQTNTTTVPAETAPITDNNSTS